MAADREVHDALVLGRRAVHAGEVGLLHRPRGEGGGEVALHALVLRHDDDAGRVLVEAVDDAGAVGADRLGQRAEVVDQRVGERAVGLSAAGVDGEARGLVDHEQELVLVDDDERDVLRLDRQGPRRRDADLDVLAAGDLRLAGDRPAVDQDVPVGDPAREHRATVLGQRQRPAPGRGGCPSPPARGGVAGARRGSVGWSMGGSGGAGRRDGDTRSGIRDGPAVAVPSPGV